MVKKAKKLENSLAVLSETSGGAPWAGLIACLVAVYALGYLGSVAMESTQAWTGTLGLALRIMLLPLLMVALPPWALFANGIYTPLVVLISAPVTCLALWYWQGRNHG
jgi:hypothetical protein